jgi:membrane protein insertase Oxa1/YidC/SpoIIIJ
MMPTRQDFLLSIIAIALCAIAVKVIFFGSPTFGDFRSLAQITDAQAKKEKMASLVSRIPVVFVRGGSVGVSGSVEIDR